MEKAEVAITTEFITMDKLLKFAGVASTGGQAFMLIEEGLVCLNGAPVQEKRKKVHPGDVVTINQEVELTITREAE